MLTDSPKARHPRGARTPALAGGLAAAAALFVLWSGALSAQQQRLHLDPVIAKLIEGKTIYGLNTGDLSHAYAKEVARAPVDFVYAGETEPPRACSAVRGGASLVNGDASGR